MTQTAQYGAFYAQFAFRDSNGYPKGVQTSPDSVANDTTMHAYLMRNLISFTPHSPTRSLFTEKGGQRIISQADMGLNELGTAAFSLSSFDDVFNGYITSSGVEATNPSGFRQAASNANNTDVPNFFAAFTAKVQSKSGSTLSSRWKTWVYPNCQIRSAIPGISQNDGVNPNPLDYEIVPNFSGRTLTGELFSATDMSVEDDQDAFYVIDSPYPIGITSYTANAANPETFTLGYRPVTTQATTSDKLLTQNGVADTISTLSISTGVLTTPTGVAGDIYVAVYSTNFIAI
jgi:hypothetical protein